MDGYCYGRWRNSQVPEEGLRANGCKAIRLSVANDMPPHYEAEKDRAKIASSPDRKDVEFEAIVIPKRTKHWAADLRKLSSFLIPDQEMSNIFSKEFAEASKKDRLSYRSSFLRYVQSRGFLLCNLANAMISIGVMLFSASNLMRALSRLRLMRGFCICLDLSSQVI